MKKISEERINELVKIYEDGFYKNPTRPPNRDEILTCLLELKQFRAEQLHRNYLKARAN